MSDFVLKIVTGISGAGKSAAIHCFEDMGYYCIDNMPPALLPSFIDLVEQTSGRIKKAAVVIDARGEMYFADLIDCLKQLEGRADFEIIFLDATTETLVRRFKETRRQHPLNNEGSIEEAIENERVLMSQLRSKASRVINTTNLSMNQLKQRLFQSYSIEGNWGTEISIISFGYKYGLPLDSDWVMDVRFLSNPFYVPELTNDNGKDTAVRDYVFADGQAEQLLKDFQAMLERILPSYIKEGKPSIIIAVGCTGGKHRSVAVAESLYESLLASGHRAMIYHRDIDHK